MSLWNLSNISELETSVLMPYREANARPIKREIRRQPMAHRFTIALSVAALTASFSIGVTQASASTINLPLSVCAVAQTFAEPTPPLARFFENRFNKEWTEGVEDELLMRLEQNRLQGSAHSLVDQTIDVVFSNQLEDLSDAKSKKLSRAEVAGLVSRRKQQR